MDQIEECSKLDAIFLIHYKIIYLNNEVTKSSNSFISPKVTSYKFGFLKSSRNSSLKVNK